MSANEIPEGVQQRHRKWFRLFQKWHSYYHILWIVALVSSVIGAGQPGFLGRPEAVSKMSSIISAFCLSALLTLKPDIRATRYLKAWRRLDETVLSFRAGRTANVEELLKAVVEGERIIGGSSF